MKKTFLKYIYITVDRLLQKTQLKAPVCIINVNKKARHFSGFNFIILS